MVTLMGATLSVLLLHELPDMLEGAGTTAISALRWLTLLVVSAAIFFVGWKTNQKKVMRAGFGMSGVPKESSPNTIFYIPLQYWSFFYLVLFASAIVVWTKQETLGH